MTSLGFSKFRFFSRVTHAWPRTAKDHSSLSLKFTILGGRFSILKQGWAFGPLDPA